VWSFGKGRYVLYALEPIVELAQMLHGFAGAHRGSTETLPAKSTPQQAWSKVQPLRGAARAGGRALVKCRQEGEKEMLEARRQKPPANPPNLLVCSPRAGGNSAQRPGSPASRRIGGRTKARFDGTVRTVPGTARRSGGFCRKSRRCWRSGASRRHAMAGGSSTSTRCAAARSRLAARPRPHGPRVRRAARDKRPSGMRRWISPDRRDNMERCR